MARGLRAAGLALAALAIALGGCGDDDGLSTEGNEELFTSAGFGEAVDAVADEVGTDAPLLSVQVTQGGANFQVREGERASGLLYTGGSLESVEIDVIGAGTLVGTDFSLEEVDPEAIDRIADAVRRRSGIDDIRITVLTLEQTPPDGELMWTVNAEGGGRAGLVFTARPDGSGIASPEDALGKAQGQLPNP